VTPRARFLVVTHVYPRHVDDDVAPFLLRYVGELRAVGVDVVVVAPHEPGLPDVHEVDGVTVHRIRYGRDDQETLAYQGDMHQRVRTPAGFARFLVLVRSMREAIRARIDDFAPDVIDVQWLVPGLWFLPVDAIRGSLQVVVLGTDLALLGRLPGGSAYGRVVLRKADSVLVMSEDARREVDEGMGRPDAVKLPPPPNVPALPPAPLPGTRRLLAIGRLVVEKGHADLLRAAAEVEPAVQVTIVGTGPERDRLVALADDLGVDLDLRDPVPPSHLDDVIAECEVFVIPSHREGFCLVAQEAMLRQRPVVATSVGALPEQLAPDGDQRTGWLVPKEDPSALAAAIAECLDPATDRVAVAVAGRRQAEDLLSRHRTELQDRIEHLIAAGER
jgi:glycosyltransferase involved in cell wall biosynthesis